MKHKDSRLKIVNEILDGIKVRTSYGLTVCLFVVNYSHNMHRKGHTAGYKKYINVQ